VNAEARRGLNDAARGFGAGAVSGGARQPARGGPAAVSIGDDGDVKAWCERQWSFGGLGLEMLRG
jgi:hypothetical protein